jgi:hypothetical protein
MLFGLQAAVVIAVGLLELIGLRAAQQMALDCVEYIYSPILDAARQLLPGAWVVMGNVFLGAAMILIGMLVYSIVGGFVFALVAGRSGAGRSR